LYKLPPLRTWPPTDGDDEQSDAKDNDADQGEEAP
jgi:hypothetical protein